MRISVMGDGPGRPRRKRSHGSLYMKDKDKRVREGAVRTDAEVRVTILLQGGGRERGRSQGLQAALEAGKDEGTGPPWRPQEERSPGTP